MMTSDENERQKTDKTVNPRQPWEQMKLSYKGRIAELVKGTMKSPGNGDPGDANTKQPGSDMT